MGGRWNVQARLFFLSTLPSLLNLDSDLFLDRESEPPPTDDVLSVSLLIRLLTGVYKGRPLAGSSRERSTTLAECTFGPPPLSIVVGAGGLTE